MTQSTEEPQQENPSEDAQKAPWGEDFDPQRAWDLVQNLRGDKDKLKTDLAQAQADREELETLRREKMTASDRAIAEARDQAEKEARAAVEAELRPKFLQAQLKGAAGQILSGPQLESFLAVTNPAVFAGDDGEIDETKVMGHLTAIFGEKQQSNHRQSWGQYSPGAPPVTPGGAGLAEAQRRQGIQPNS